MTTSEKIGAVILLVWCVLWLLFFGYFMFIMPEYGVGGH
jgi:hypothetical protein